MPRPRTVQGEAGVGVPEGVTSRHEDSLVGLELEARGDLADGRGLAHAVGPDDEQHAGILLLLTRNQWPPAAPSAL